VAAIIEGIVGTLFLAILIAKLVGVYPPPSRDHRSPAPRSDDVKPSGDITRCRSTGVVHRLLLAGSFWTLLPFLGGLIWAATVVIATWPLLLQLRARTGTRPGWRCHHDHAGAAGGDPALRLRGEHAAGRGASRRRCVRASS
jgi:hypothetical protein